MAGENGRRKFLQAIGTTAVVSTAGCAGVLQSESEFEKQLGKVEEATKQYEDPKKALEDGFKIGGPYVPGMGWHFSHPERLKKAAGDGLDVEKPPLLTYLDNDDTDGLRLGSVEYGVPAEAVGEAPDLFDDENADATEEWHTHEAATHVFATPDDEQNSPKDLSFEQWTTKDNWAEFTPPDQNLEAGDAVELNWGTAKGKEGETEERVADLVTQHPDLKTLHAWVHVDNPAGVFNPVNTEYTEDGHSH